MKNMIRKTLSISIITAMLLFLLSNYILQIKVAQNEMALSSMELFQQIEHILERNSEELKTVTDDFKEQCLIRAKAAAYILQYRPSILKDQNEMKKIAALLQVDELHVFDTKGTLYAGSEPKYFGYTFYSGEQMNFFLPLLEDHSLELCQDITPNTAENKLMQYAAVWQENEKGIVQIGMEPNRIIDLTEKNKLSHVFSMLTTDNNTILYAIDPESHIILGSTDKTLVGKTLMEINISPEKINSDSTGFHSQINGESSYCYFYQSEDIILSRSHPVDNLYQHVRESTFFLALYLAAISYIVVTLVLRYLDRNIIASISIITRKLEKIATGNLDERVDVHTTPEFTELSHYTNHMVESLLDSTDKMSTILDIVQIPIASYEYGPGMERVRVTRRFSSILDLTEEETSYLLSDYHLFEKKLEKIRQHPLKEENAIFRLDTNSNRYIKMESFTRDSNTLGILLDVTDDILEKMQIEQERDYDLLTGLYSRRAFYSQLDSLFFQPELLEHSAIVMIDSDNLKHINDCYGHQNGDRYLCGIADILRSSTAPHKLFSRLSGDEFAVLIYNCNSRAELLKYLDELKEKSESDYLLNEDMQLQVVLSFSVGFAFYGEDGTDYHSLLKSADMQMYEDKRRKKKKK